MSDPEKKICRYFNTLGGCWYGDSCKFLHIPNKKPPCKFFGSSTGCRYGESCHFSHDRTPFKSVENYGNQSVELMKEVFKENMDPSELSGTNNNNMTQSASTLASPGQQAVQPAASTTDSTLFDSDTASSTPSTLKGALVTDSCDPSKDGSQLECDTRDSKTPTTITNSAGEMMTSTNSKMMIANNANSACVSPGPIHIGKQQLSTVESIQEKVDESQNYALTPVGAGRACSSTAEVEIFCGSCKRILERRGNESYCTLLKDHYLECFLDKEGDHVKYVKTKAALEPGQMYWCKSCILIFEKPWSLFQHMADKAKGNKVQRWEKKIHLDWMDSVAGLMAGYDLGLFSPAKLRIDLRNLLADQHTMEEEMEAAAVTAAAMMQWLAPLSSPWRLQQREMMRKIEQLNRQMLRKANIGLAGGAGYPMRAALTAAPQTGSSYGNSSRNSSLISSNVNEATSGLLSHQPRCSSSHSFALSTSTVPPSPQLVEHESHLEIREVKMTEEGVGPLGDGGMPSLPEETAQTTSNSSTEVNSEPTGASGDCGTTPMSTSTSVSKTSNVEKSGDSVMIAVDSNNTNSVASARGDEGRPSELRATSSTSGHVSLKHGGASHRGLNDKVHASFTGGGRALRSNSQSHVYVGSRTNSRINRTNSGCGASLSRAASVYTPPTFTNPDDYNYGFTDEEVEELLSQGIKPWDSEATAALAVLRGELDHLLDLA